MCGRVSGDAITLSDTRSIHHCAKWPMSMSREMATVYGPLKKSWICSLNDQVKYTSIRSETNRKWRLDMLSPGKLQKNPKNF